MAIADAEILNAVGETVAVFDSNNNLIGNIVGVFERQYIETLDVQGFAPTFTFLKKTISINQNYVIVIETKSFTVRYLEPDGTGMTVAIMREK